MVSEEGVVMENTTATSDLVIRNCFPCLFIIILLPVKRPPMHINSTLEISLFFKLISWIYNMVTVEIISRIIFCFMNR